MKIYFVVLSLQTYLFFFFLRGRTTLNRCYTNTKDSIHSITVLIAHVSKREPYRMFSIYALMPMAYTRECVSVNWRSTHRGLMKSKCNTRTEWQATPSNKKKHTSAVEMELNSRNHELQATYPWAYRIGTCRWTGFKPKARPQSWKVEGDFGYLQVSGMPTERVTDVRPGGLRNPRPINSN